MKTLIAALFLFGTLCRSSSAPVFYDSFNYSPVGTSLSTAGPPEWSLRTGTGGDPTIASGSLNYPGLQTAPGDNSVAFNGLAPAAGVASRSLGPTAYTSGTLYYSLTFNVTSITTADWGGSATNYNNGSFMMGFSDGTSTGGALNGPNAGAPLLIRTGDPTNATGTANDFQGYQLGTGVTAATAPPSSRVFDNTRVYAPNQTLFLVLSYTFGPNAADDVARLYVNPVPGTLEAANIPVVVTTVGTTDVATNQLQSFFLRNNSVEPATTQIDDLRVGTTWEDVTPVPEPSTFGMLGLAAAGLLIRRSRR